MIKYHGTPMTNPSKLLENISSYNVRFLISWANKQDINKIVSLGNNFILDNGAFTFWKKENKNIRWDKYYEWVEKYPQRDNFFIPDVIDGSEKENDKLLETNELKDGIPVWHLHESLNRLNRLANNYDYIAFGSSGEYKTLGAPEWNLRMDKAMQVVCDKDGFPLVKIHMLRCLNAKIFTKYPFYSGDSTNVARNSRNRPYQKIIKNIEPYNSPKKYKFLNIYQTKNLFDV